MLYPLNNLMDCNFYHYALQISIYAYMIQKMNPDFEIESLKLVHFDHKNNVTQYEVEYLKDDVERLLKHYKKLAIRDAQKQRLKRIEY